MGTHGFKILVGVSRSVASNARRHADNNTHGRHIVRHNATGADYSPIADRYASQQSNIRSDPDLVTDKDWPTSHVLAMNQAAGIGEVVYDTAQMLLKAVVVSNDLHRFSIAVRLELGRYGFEGRLTDGSNPRPRLMQGMPGG